MNPPRRLMLRAGMLVLGAGLWRLPGLQAAEGPRVIKLTARRFQFEPAEIALQVGQAVVVEIESMDFVHGMSLPDLGLRLDLTPGQIIRLPLQPKQPGVIEFVCDNFCGDGHEAMHGRFVVSA